MTQIVRFIFVGAWIIGAVATCAYPDFQFTNKGKSTTPTPSSTVTNVQTGGSGGTIVTGGTGGMGGFGGAPCALGLIGVCGDGKKCTVVDENTGLAGCAEAGTRLAWSKCNFDAECVDGTWCDHLLSVCKPLCQNGNECGTGECLPAVDSSLRIYIPNLLACTSYCHPITAEPCDKTNFVTCVYRAETFDCGASKNYAEHTSCQYLLDCGPGLTCVGSGSGGAGNATCRKWCTPPGFSIACTSLLCNSTTPQVFHAGAQYGVCAE